MANKQYRWRGLVSAQAEFGNAMLALACIPGSGKKILIHSLEVHPLNRAGGTGDCHTALVRCVAEGGRSIKVSPRDTTSALPGGISVRVEGAASSIQSPSLMENVRPQTINPGSNQLLPRIGPSTRYISDEWMSFRDGDTQPLVIRPSESIALLSVTRAAGTTTRGQRLVDVKGTFICNGNTYDFSTFAAAVGEDTSIISIANNSSSSVVTLKRLLVTECGSRDTPYLQLVQLGAIDPQSLADPTVRLTPIPMDTAYGAMSDSIAMLMSNVAVRPASGLPQSYLTEGSGSAIRGFNYLHAKDFAGPSLFAIFPEVTGIRGSLQSDSCVSGLSNKTRNIVSPGSPIVLRPGEAVGLCGATETAASTSYVTTPGWCCFDIGITFSVEPAAIPTISVTGMIEGSRYRVERIGDGSLVADGVAPASGTLNYLYSVFDTTENMRLKVRNASGDPAYKPVELTFALTSSGITIPIVQEQD